MKLAAIIVAALSLTACTSSVGDRFFLDRPKAWNADIYREAHQNLTARGEALREAAPFIATNASLFKAVIRRHPEPPGRTAPAGSAAFTYDILPSDHASSEPGVTLTPTLYNSILASYAADRKAQIDKLCFAYFQNLDDAGGAAKFSQSQVNSIGDFAAVLMGITGSPAEHLAILAGGQALLNDTFDATSAMLLLSPPPSVVFDLVKARQREIAAAAEVKGFRTVGDVELFISNYAATCVPVGIRAIVTSTVAAQADERNPDVNTAGQQAATLAVREALNLNLQTDQKLSTLASDHAAYVLWYLGMENCEDDRAVICEHIKGQVPADVWSALTAQSGDRRALAARMSTLAGPAINTRKGELMAAYERDRAAETNESLQEELDDAENQAVASQQAADDRQRTIDEQDARLVELTTKLERLTAENEALKRQAATGDETPGE